MPDTMKRLLVPRNIQVQEIGPCNAKIVLEPFERGMGHTLGNSIRRILLSFIPGCAATEVSIDGVLHEYSTIEGIKEDVIDILLNLKQVAFILPGKDVVTLFLKKKGPGAVTAGDITLDQDVEIINPEHVIANINGDSELNMTIKVCRGRGYSPANARISEEEDRIIGSLLLDASFSPVRRVSYVVESARVEKRTDLDKLVLFLETDGTVTPEEAIRDVATIFATAIVFFR